MVAVAILAGGAGRRLGGVRKPWLEIGGRTILARAIEAARTGGLGEVLVLGATEADVLGLDARAVPDRTPDEGPLAALATALAEVPRLVLVPGDAPFLEPALLRALATDPRDAAALVPVVDGHPQPQLARWDAAALPAAEALLAGGHRALRDLTARVPWIALDEPWLRAVDPTLSSFFDVDTPENLAAARSRA